MKKVYIFIIILLVLLVGSLTFYKFVYLKDKPVNNVDKNVEMVRKDVKKEEKDEVTYQSDIINDNVLSSSYKIDTITGSIYIDTKDKKLYISDTTNNITEKISDTSFVTMYVTDKDEMFTAYLISENKEVYFVYLMDEDIKNVRVNKMNLEFKVERFTNLKFKTNSSIVDSVIVLASDGYMYDLISGMGYSSDIISLDNMYYVYGDKTIANSYGYMLKNDKDEYYKIKNYLYLLDNKVFDGVNALIITDKNELIYSKNGSNIITTYGKKVSEVKVSKGVDTLINATIVFTDGTNIKLHSINSEYFGF